VLQAKFHGIDFQVDGDLVDKTFAGEATRDITGRA
jgi:hypothetical protein